MKCSTARSACSCGWRRQTDANCFRLLNANGRRATVWTLSISGIKTGNFTCCTMPESTPAMPPVMTAITGSGRH